VLQIVKNQTTLHSQTKCGNSSLAR